MKFIYFLTILAFLVIVVIGLMNLVSMFDEENCVCLEENGKCVLYTEIKSPKPKKDYQRRCGEGACKYFFGNCYNLHRYLDVTYVIRGC